MEPNDDLQNTTPDTNQPEIPAMEPSTPEPFASEPSVPEAQSVIPATPSETPSGVPSETLAAAPLAQPVASTAPVSDPAVSSSWSSTPDPLAAPTLTSAPDLASNPAPASDPTSTPVIAPDPAPKKKSKKGLIIGIVAAAVVVAGLISGGAAYAFVYNAPDNAVADAFSKLFSAKSVSGTATASIALTGDMAVNGKAEVSFASNEAGQASADLTLSTVNSGKTYTLKGHLAGTKDTGYIKVDDLRSLLTSTLGSEYISYIDDYYGGLLDKLDTKWVVIKQSDLDSLSNGEVKNTESACVQNEIGKLHSDSSLANEIIDTYKKYPLFTVQSKGSDSNGNHYVLTPVSSAQAKQFATALADTKFVKALDDCTSGEIKKALTDTSNTDSSTTTLKNRTTALELWIDGWSHNINKATYTIKDDGGNFTSEVNLKLNSNPAVTIPKADTTVSDIQAEIKKLEEQTTTSDDTYSTSSSTLLNSGSAL